MCFDDWSGGMAGESALAHPTLGAHPIDAIILPNLPRKKTHFTGCREFLHSLNQIMLVEL